jgi:hypothetical protein
MRFLLDVLFFARVEMSYLYSTYGEKKINRRAGTNMWLDIHCNTGTDGHLAPDTGTWHRHLAPALL